MGKCHVTMIWCEEINNLLDELEVLVSLFFLQYTFQSVCIFRYDLSLVFNQRYNYFSKTRMQTTLTLNQSHHDQPNSDHLLYAVQMKETTI